MKNIIHFNTEVFERSSKDNSIKSLNMKSKEFLPTISNKIISSQQMIKDDLKKNIKSKTSKNTNDYKLKEEISIKRIKTKLNQINSRIDTYNIFKFDVARSIQIEMDKKMEIERIQREEQEKKKLEDSLKNPINIFKYFMSNEESPAKKIRSTMNITKTSENNSGKISMFKLFRDNTNNDKTCEESNNQNFTKDTTEEETLNTNNEPENLRKQKRKSLKEILKRITMKRNRNSQEELNINTEMTNQEENLIKIEETDFLDNDDNKNNNGKLNINKNLMTDNSISNLETRKKFGTSLKLGYLNSQKKEMIESPKKQIAKVVFSKKKTIKPVIYKQTKPFLIDEIIDKYQKYLNEKEKMSSEEIENLPPFKISNFFSIEKLEKDINDKFRLATKFIKKRDKSKSTESKRKESIAISRKFTTSKKIGETSNLSLHKYVEKTDNSKSIEKLKINKKLNQKLEKLKQHKITYSLSKYQEKILYLLKDSISTENLRNLALKFKEISDKNDVKYVDDNIIYKKRIKGPKTRMELTLERISPYIPEFLCEKLKTIK